MSRSEAAGSASIQRWVILVCTGLTMLAVLSLVQTNSRTSILIKETSYVAGAALLALGVLAAGISGRLRFAPRLGAAQLLPLLAVLLIGPAFMAVGAGSVGTPYASVSLLALSTMAVALALLADRRTRDRLVALLLAAGGLVCIYALLQWWGIEVFEWDRSLARSGRVSGSLGNPNLMGSLAAALPPLAVGYAVYRRARPAVLIGASAAAVLLCGLAIVASGTRGSLLGLGAGFGVLAVLMYRRIGRRRAAAVVLILVAGAVLAFLPMRARLGELAGGEGGTLTVRRVIWSGAARAFLQRPVLGWGPGSFQKVFPAFRDPHYHTMGVSHNTLHAHCEYLELLMDSGIAGALLWAALVAAIAVRRRRLGGLDALGAGILAAIAALLTEALVSVALRWPPSAMLLALLSGLAMVPARGSGERWVRVRRPAALLALVPAGLLAASLPMYADAMRSGRLLFAGKDRNLARSEPAMNRAYAQAASWASGGDAAAGEAALRRWDEAVVRAEAAIELCEECVEVNPNDLGGWYALGSSYLTRAILASPSQAPMRELLRQRRGWSPDSLGEARMTRRALEAYRRLMELAPNYAEVHNNMALVHTRLDQLDSAMVYMRNAYGLHGHRRFDYFQQVSSLGPVLESDDAWWIFLAQEASLRSGKIGRDRSRRESVMRSLFWSAGGLFGRYPERADSLARLAAGAIGGGGITLEGRGLEEVLLDLAYRERLAVRLEERLEAGDTAGVLASLDSLPEAVYPSRDISLVRARAAAPSSADLAAAMAEHLHFTMRGLRVHLGRMPMGTDQIAGLFRAAVASPEEPGWWVPARSGLVGLLYLDAEMANVNHLAHSEFPRSTRDSVAQLLEERWRGLGGPRFCAGTGRSPAPWTAGGALGALTGALDSLAALPDSTGAIPGEADLARIETAYLVLSTQMWRGPYMSQAQMDSVMGWAAPSVARLADSLGGQRYRDRVSRRIRLAQRELEPLVTPVRPEGMDALESWFCDPEASRAGAPVQAP
jgi:O-antigen ligase